MIPLVTAKFSKPLSLRPPEGIHVQGPGTERPRASCLLLSQNDDQLQADSANLQEFNLSNVLSVLSILIVLILRSRLDFRLMAPAQSCSEETFRQSGTWSTARAGTARAGTARHRSWCPCLESHPSKGGKDVS